MKKLMLAATALVVVAFTALPAVAAASPEMDFSETNDGHFTVTGPAGVLSTENTEIECEEVTGTGQFENGQTGTVEFIFHECEETIFGSACTTSGQSTGTIATTPELPFHLKTVDTGEGKEDLPAVLVTPADESHGKGEGHYASFECLGGFIGVEVTGRGIIGEITEPVNPGPYNVASNTFGITFKTDANGVQTPLEVNETPGVEYDLTASINGGEPETAGEDATGQMHFTEGTGTLTTLEE